MDIPSPTLIPFLEDSSVLAESESLFLEPTLTRSRLGSLPSLDPVSRGLSRNSLIASNPKTIKRKISGKNQTVIGSSGNDVLDASKGKGKNKLLGKKGNDRLKGKRQDRLIGGPGDDRLDTRKGSKNILKGGGGSDLFFVGKKDKASGGGGSDTLDASKGRGQNTLMGGGGDDVLIGKMGDRLIGGSGADEFVLVKSKLPEKALIVQDFQQGRDRLVIKNFPDATVFNDLTLTQKNTDTFISIQGQSVAILENFTATQLTSDDIDGIAPASAPVILTPLPTTPTPLSVQVSIADDEVFEGNPGDDAQVSFIVSLDRAADQDISITYQTVSVTNGATQDSDYISTQGILVIPQGSTTRLIDIPIIEDFDDEENESFELKLLRVEGAEIVDGTAIGIIKDDEDEVVTSQRSNGYSSTSYDESTVYSQFEVVQTTITGTAILDSYPQNNPMSDSNGLFIGAIRNYQSGESEYRVPDSFVPDDITILLVANLESQLIYNSSKDRYEIEYRIVSQEESKSELIHRIDADFLTESEQLLAVNSLSYIIENNLLDEGDSIIKRGDDLSIEPELISLGSVRDTKKYSYYSSSRIDISGISSLIEEFTLAINSSISLNDESPDSNIGTFIGAIEDYTGPMGSFSEGDLKTSLSGNIATYILSSGRFMISGTLDLAANGLDSDAAINDVDYILDNDLLKSAFFS